MSDSTLPNRYDAHAAAARYYPEWEAAGLFKGDPEHPGDPFCIVIPPPNVTGNLHMGHALDNTLQDILIRYKRMDGYAALWVPGTDHAGIATQLMVTRQLAEEGTTPQEIGRDAFLFRTWAWKEEYGGNITHQLRKLGASCDWSREAFTMSPQLSKAVRAVFVKLYREGLIYRDHRLVNWDPGGRTVLSDLEVEYSEEQGQLWSFAYALSDGSGEIIVATTRPETMLGDTAVAVHPEDPRHAHLIGRTVYNPLVDRHIPIIGDAELVDMEFGTGAVKITPAHDHNDFACGKRHELEMINIFTVDAKVNANGGRFEGMDRFEARRAVKAAMAELGLDRGTDPHKLRIGRSQRGNAVVEPMLSTQWYVAMKPLAAPAIAAVERGITDFVPKGWENTYFAWMREIRDWCISRQLWWGHRIPAWYCEACEHVTVSEADPEACEGCGGAAISQDEDVLDTWFSSALWPFSVLGWPDDTADLRKWYPTSVLVTGFDIIFFWVARMMFSGLHNMGAVPFHKVCIHGMVRDEHGQKMSKTKGNVVNPLRAIEKFGCDAFRFTLAYHTTQGSDINWGDQLVEVSSRFTNKIWQAFRYTHMNLEGYDPAAEVELSETDRWILARLGLATQRIRAALDDFRFDEAASELRAFIWDELCDWYLEFSKAAIYGGGAPRQAAQHVLVEVFGAVARLMHPIMPFLSEELWQLLPGTEGSVMIARYPRPEDYPQAPEILEQIASVQEAIIALRRLRADMGLSPKQPLPLQVRGERAALLLPHERALQHLAGIGELSILDGEPPAGSATAVATGLEMFVPLEGVVDLDAERERLDKELAKVAKDVSDLQKRLGNQKFVDRAPAHVVEDFREKLAVAEEKLGQLRASREALGA
ncbi:MAG: valine--tRNA ligase [Alphaproteobacteria bacterium]|nr:valine--tRNA ligase [Alphaproteobacteria bacterium]MCB9791786.1 valine--tRNA ligase [Alphaproteobacteria bacterium]